MLGFGDFNLVHLTGCSNWAMALIFEISSLDRWRDEEEKVHRLSFKELVKRGVQIEERLRRRLAEFEDELLKQGPVDSSLKGRPDYASMEITRIFALSAITYLQVVVSGAYPEIPEIRESVSKTLDALRNFTDPSLLRHLVWPFCVTGCLAVDEQQDRFQELVTAVHTIPSTSGTIREAFDIMRECWRLRKAGKGNYDWTSVMKKRGQYILLA